MENTPAEGRSFLQKLTGGGPIRTRDKILVGIIIVLFLFVFYVTLDANKYRAEVRVIEGEGKVGVNPTTERLDFGDLSRGTTAVRRVTLENGTFMPMYVMVWKLGNLSELMDIDRESFRLAPGKTQEVNFTTYMPASAEIGKQYTGRVYIFKIPTFWL